MASSELRSVIDARRANPYTPAKTIPQLREETESGAAANPIPEDTLVRHVAANGVPCAWAIAPESADSGKVFLFIHGGGYYRGSVKSSLHMAARFSQCTGYRCLSVDYRLAPEYAFPAAIDDVVSAYRYLLDGGTDAKHIVVGGISAGGGLTLALLLAAKEQGLPQPAAAVPMSAWTDLTQSGGSFQDNAEVDPTISKPYLDRMSALYVQTQDPRTPLASPLFGDLSGLAPLLIQVGSVETMLHDSTAFAEKAKAAGVEAQLEVWDDMPHGWQNNYRVLPESQQAIDRIAEFCREKLG